MVRRDDVHKVLQALERQVRIVGVSPDHLIRNFRIVQPQGDHPDVDVFVLLFQPGGLFPGQAAALAGNAVIDRHIDRDAGVGEVLDKLRVFSDRLDRQAALLGVFEQQLDVVVVPVAHVIGKRKHPQASTVVDVVDALLVPVQDLVDVGCGLVERFGLGGYHVIDCAAPVKRLDGCAAGRLHVAVRAGHVYAGINGLLVHADPGVRISELVPNSVMCVDVAQVAKLAGGKLIGNVGEQVALFRADRTGVP